MDKDSNCKPFREWIHLSIVKELERKLKELQDRGAGGVPEDLVG